MFILGVVYAQNAPHSAGGPDSVNSAKGADARRQTAKELAKPWGGALGTAPVLRELLGSSIDPQIARVIASIKAIDNHAHPVLPPPHDRGDRGFDALPVDNMEPQTDPVAWRADNPQLPLAWKALWGFAGKAPLDAQGMSQLEAARSRVKAQQGVHYDEWVLDHSGIETMLANRVVTGPGITPPRFRWVAYEDALLFPLDNTALAATTPDKKLFFPLEERIRARYLQDLGLGAIPSTLDEYIANIVVPTLRKQHAKGAVAAKFEIAYLRGFGFSDPSREDAQRIYRKYVGQGTVAAADYQTLQDFLFRVIAAECGRLGMVVHLHCMSGGGSYFGIAGANPLLLEPIFNDPRLRGTKFVLLHGGWPFVREAGALLQKPNVYLDLSQQSLTFPPHTLAGWLREWLETFPDKVLYGTDGYPFSAELGWEESTWIANHNAREALGLALTGMLRDGEISLDRARDIAESVLRRSAEQLYAMR
ncbi:MAG: amidohydrolase family protein [Acidobacteriaceae bacterium]|nr:amidohydrolase family protein [Acidobacteriaceae bacterium]